MRKCLVVDARWLRGGIGTYTLNVLDGLRRYGDGIVARAIIREKDAERLGPLSNGFAILDLPIYTLREQIGIPWAARGAALLHSTHYNAPLLFPGRLLVTIHDLIHITDSLARRRAASWFYARPMLNLVSRRACRIIAVSEHSKAQLVERLRVSPEKITVIYNGVNPDFRVRDHEDSFWRVCRELSLDRPYILYVGNLKPHKNVGTLLAAFASLRAQGVDTHRLLLVGGDAKWRPRLAEECSRLKIEEHVSFVPRVSAELLPHVYAAADLLVMPSLLEGFGFPVVEAMACGTPVACSRAASLPEIAGDAAEFFDPRSAEDMGAAIQRVLESRDLRAALRRKGLERAALYSWDRCARNHCQVYRDLLQA